MSLRAFFNQRLWLVAVVLTTMLNACTSAMSAPSYVEDEVPEEQHTDAAPTVDETLEPTELSARAQTGDPLTVVTVQSGDLTAAVDWLYADTRFATYSATLYLPDDLTDEQALEMVVYDQLVDANNNLIFGPMNGGRSAMPDAPHAIEVRGNIEYGAPLPSDVLDEMKLRFDVFSTTSDQPVYSLDIPMEPYLTPSTTVDANVLQVANNIEMRLQRITYTPGWLQATVCYDETPETAGYWPDVTLYADGQALDWTGGSSVLSSDSDSATTCMVIEQIESYTGNGKGLASDRLNTLTLSVDALVGPPPQESDEEKFARANKRLAEHGIEIAKPDHGYGWDLIRAPEGMSDGEIAALVIGAFFHQVAGPWTFQIPWQD